MLCQTTSPMENLINTSNNFNDQYICEPDKKWTLIDGTDVYSTKVIPILYNLPDDRYLVDDIKKFANKEGWLFRIFITSLKNSLLNG